MSRRPLLALLLALPVAVLADDAPVSPRRAMKDGRAAFNAGDFTDAAKAFRDAAAHADERGLDPAVARYNEGTALARSEALGPAIDALQEAARTPDPTLQAKAHYNLGTALLERATMEESAQQLSPALQSTKDALDAFDRAMALDPSDRDTKLNYEWATLQAERLQQEIQRQQQQQQQQNQQGQENEQQQQQDGQTQQSQQGERDSQQPETAEEESGDDQEQQQGAGEQESEEPQQQGKQGQSGESEDDAARDARRMSEQEAETLLDAMKAREQGLREQVARERLRQGAGQLAPVEKDW